MIKIDENGNVLEKMSVMEGIPYPVSQMLYTLYRHILDTVEASNFPEGKEIEILCGHTVEVLNTTPWLQTNIGKKGYILLTNEQYSLIGFTDNPIAEGEKMDIGKMRYAVFRNEDLKVIPESKIEGP